MKKIQILQCMLIIAVVHIGGIVSTDSSSEDETFPLSSPSKKRGKRCCSSKQSKGRSCLEKEDNFEEDK